MKKVTHYVTLAVLSKEKYEWSLIKLTYEETLISLGLWLENGWEDYNKYERIVIVDDITLEFHGGGQI